MKLLILLLSMSFMITPSAKLFILVGPSGVGKSTLIQKLAGRGVAFEPLITHTTRAMRPGEVHAKDYFFISMQEYEKKKENDEFILPVSHYGNHYGTCKQYINSKLSTGNHLIGALTGNVAKQMNDIMAGNVITIFIAPPSFEMLKQRLVDRKTESATSLQMRLDSAVQELHEQDFFDYKIINDDLDQATKNLRTIFETRSK